MIEVDIDQRIKELLPTGMSFAEMGKTLGVTKGTIAGKVTRMRLRGDLDRLNRPVVMRGTPENPLERMIVSQEQLTLKVKVERCLVQAPANAPGVHLLDLKEGDCRFSIAYYDSGHFFCGAPRRDLKTRYCAEHHTIVWVKRDKPSKGASRGVVFKSSRFGDDK
jgi:hypothetical protein